MHRQSGPEICGFVWGYVDLEHFPACPFLLQTFISLPHCAIVKLIIFGTIMNIHTDTEHQCAPSEIIDLIVEGHQMSLVTLINGTVKRIHSAVNVFFFINFIGMLQTTTCTIKTSVFVNRLHVLLYITLELRTISFYYFISYDVMLLALRYMIAATSRFKTMYHHLVRVK